MDKDERYKYGEFDTKEEAIACCKKIVDEFFEPHKTSKLSYQELWSGYTTYGEDPFIVTEDKSFFFSAWDYAKQKCQELSA
jgi:ATP-dependent exoDNAse (exonuclease V) alpha subunit